MLFSNQHGILSKLYFRAEIQKLLNQQPPIGDNEMPRLEKLLNDMLKQLDNEENYVTNEAACTKYFNIRHVFETWCLYARNYVYNSICIAIEKNKKMFPVCNSSCYSTKTSPLFIRKYGSISPINKSLKQ